MTHSPTSNHSKNPGFSSAFTTLGRLPVHRVSVCPTLSQAATRILLLPVGTAGVERTFSTMNRILCSERSRLLPDHVNSLMKISIEGPAIPNIRSQFVGTSDSEGLTECADNYNQCIDSAYQIWLMKPRRNV